MKQLSLVCFILVAQSVYARAACNPDDHPQPNIGLSEESGIGNCPSGMAPVGNHCMDVYEASLLEIKNDGTGVPWSPYHNPGKLRVKAVSLRSGVPQGYISGEQAARACRESGKRLCTSSEWTHACKGSHQWTYPYGPDRIPKRCNDSRKLHPALELFPHDPHPYEHLDNACLNQLANGLAKSGDYSGCVTDDGIYDLMGSLHEWTADESGTFQGGYYVDTTRNGNGCNYKTTAHNFKYWDYSTGFRCCAD